MEHRCLSPWKGAAVGGLIAFACGSAWSAAFSPPDLLARATAAFFWTWILGKIPGLTLKSSALYGLFFGLSVGVLGAPLKLAYVADAAIAWTLASMALSRCYASACAPPARSAAAAVALLLLAAPRASADHDDPHRPGPVAPASSPSAPQRASAPVYRAPVPIPVERPRAAPLGPSVSVSTRSAPEAAASPAPAPANGEPVAPPVKHHRWGLYGGIGAVVLVLGYLTRRR